LRRTGFEVLEQRVWKIEGGAHGCSFAQKHICAQWVAVGFPVKVQVQD
jgi:hypothetical protein